MANKNHCDDCGGWETTGGQCHKCSGLGSLIPGFGEVVELLSDIGVEDLSREEIFDFTAQFDTVPLSPKAFEYISSQISTNMSKQERRQPIVSKRIANHIYIFENKGFGRYRIIDIIPLD
jgi:hypothetical protein